MGDVYRGSSAVGTVSGMCVHGHRLQNHHKFTKVQYYTLLKRCCLHISTMQYSSLQLQIIN